MITCPLVHLLSFVLRTWSSELWPVLLGALIRVGALRVCVSAKLLNMPTMALLVLLLSRSLCDSSSDGLSEKWGRQKGV